LNAIDRAQRFLTKIRNPNSNMTSRVKSLTFYWLPLIVYCVLIYVQSDYPSPESLPSFKFSDKLLHFAAYAVMGVLFYRAYQTLSFKNNIPLLMLLSIISTSLYGISDEFHQSYVPLRDGSLLDLMADILGAICGVYLYHLWAMPRAGNQLNSEVGLLKPKK